MGAQISSAYNPVRSCGETVDLSGVGLAGAPSGTLRFLASCPIASSWPDSLIAHAEWPGQVARMRSDLRICCDPGMGESLTQSYSRCLCLTATDTLTQALR